MTLFVVRHASAGVRGHFDGDDRLRPLDPLGHAQSRAISGALENRPIVRLLSSEAARCTQTFAPLSQALGLPVETHQALLEGSRPVVTLELLRDLAAAGGDAAVCSHGDVIPPVLSLLALEGVVLTGGRTSAKGSIWELEVRGRDIVSARYHPTSRLDRDLAAT